ncbi:hypothetical protein AAG747_12695 [Rapidithrix thailandica]|uniref:Uncharacterized protein n=1 Tax=Rapidithrix thailandica TaxID=413964 RepID=A0AAW9SD37_9BACT
MGEVAAGQEKAIFNQFYQRLTAGLSPDVCASVKETFEEVAP